jgi:pimeloyl-ACP methyl ester carboxylesterase
MASSTRFDGHELVIEIPVGIHYLGGNLTIPQDAIGIVVFAHGSGSSRFSPRNRFVASVLQTYGLGTLLMDLLDADEGRESDKVFDIRLLSNRLSESAQWLTRQEDEIASLPFGLFGASTGGAAALVAAAESPAKFRAVVSRGGRPDLAGDYLPLVKTPTLLIVGGNDDVVVKLNEEALRQLRCSKQLVIVPGATHLFEEPGTLAKVARLAKDCSCITFRPNRPICAMRPPGTGNRLPIAWRPLRGDIHERASGTATNGEQAVHLERLVRLVGRQCPA